MSNTGGGQLEDLEHEDLEHANREIGRATLPDGLGAPRIGHDRITERVAFRPDGTMLASNNLDGTINRSNASANNNQSADDDSSAVGEWVDVVDADDGREIQCTLRCNPVERLPPPLAKFLRRRRILNDIADVLPLATIAFITVDNRSAGCESGWLPPILFSRPPHEPVGPSQTRS